MLHLDNHCLSFPISVYAVGVKLITCTTADGAQKGAPHITHDHSLSMLIIIYQSVSVVCIPVQYTMQRYSTANSRFTEEYFGKQTTYEWFVVRTYHFLPIMQWITNGLQVITKSLQNTWLCYALGELFAKVLKLANRV